MNENPVIGKVRRRLGREQRRELMEAFGQRQEAAVDFARRHGVATSTLHRWMRAERSGNSPRVKPVAFREIHVSGGGVGPWSGEVCLADGTLVRWNGEVGLAGALRLVQQLRRPC